MGLCGDADRGTAALVGQVNNTVRVAMGKRCVAACSSVQKNSVNLYSFLKVVLI